MVTARALTAQTMTPALDTPRGAARPQTARPTARAAPTRSVRPAVRLSGAAQARAEAGLPLRVSEVVRSPGAGEELPPRVRAALENSLEVPLRPVRLHRDARSAAAVESLGARAFTYGLHVFLGPRERPEDLPLMAHEVAHVVQQQGRGVLQMSAAGARGDGFEQEAHQVSEAVGRGEKVTVRGRTEGARVQGVWPADEMAGWARESAWALLNEHAPQLAPILRRGVLEWLKERLGAVLQSVFDELARPVRAVRDVASAVGRHFGNLIGRLREAASGIARNDCAPIAEAAEKIQQAFEGLTAPVIQRVQHFTEQASGLFRGLNERFGAPVMDVLRQVGGAVWEQIQRFGNWVWEGTQPIRAMAGSVWSWFKDWLGIGAGEEGRNGVVQWFRRKAGEAWNWVLARLAPFRRPLTVVAGVLVMLSPAGPIVAVAGAAAGVMRGVQWIRQHLRTRGGVVRQQSFLRGTILPAILGAVNGVGVAARGAADRISGALHRVMDGIGEMAGAVNSVPILGFAGGLVGFVADAFRGLAGWADEGVRGLAEWVQGGLERLGAFARMMVNFLEEAGRAAADVRRLAHFLAGRLWNAIPACIRDPFIDFFIPLILRQIPFFRELASTPEAWQQTRADVMQLLRGFFRDFDLMGAMRTAFRLLLRALRVPVDLAAQVLQKAARSWDVVLARPIQFLQNLLRATGQGFRRFFGNILSHLWYGVQGWLFDQLGDVGITPPATWDLRGVFGLVLQVAGVSLERVLELLASRVGRPVVERIRRAVNFLSGAWEWLRVAVTEGPAGMWRMLVDRLRDLGRMVLESAVGWVMRRIIAQVSVRLTALLASAGLGAVVEAFKALYNAIQTALEYARRILEILNTVFDTVLQIAEGVFGPAAETLERGLRTAMPVVIGFLANYIGLGGLGERIREIILGIRERVDSAILWLIDRALSAGRWLMDMLRAGAAAVMEWWRRRKPFRSSNGADHTLLFQGEAGGAALHVRSVDTPLSRYIGRIRQAGTPIPQRITDIQEEIYSLRVRFVRHTGESEVRERRAHPSIDVGERISELLNELGEELKKLPDPDRPGASLVMPVTELVEHESQSTDAAAAGLSGNSEDGRRVEVKPLSIRPGTLRGSDASYSSELFTAVENRRGTYVRGHLLGAHLYGPGESNGGRWNLTPITEAANRAMTSVENRLHSLVFTQNKVLWVKVRAQYPLNPMIVATRPIRAEHFLPTTISYEIQTMKPKVIANQDPAEADRARESGANWEPDASIPVSEIQSRPPLDAPIGGTQTLNNTPDRLIRTKTGASQAFSQGLVTYINEFGHFDNKRAFIEQMSAAEGKLHRGADYPSQATIDQHTRKVADQLNDDLTWKSAPTGA